MTLRDTFNREILEPHAIVTDAWINPVKYWQWHASDHPWNENAPPSCFIKRPELRKEDYAEYFIPAPDTTSLMRVECQPTFSSTLYFKAQSDNSEAVLHLDLPSISPDDDSFYASAMESPSAKWAERILTTSRRAEMRNGKHHYKIKPYDEMQALYKCTPGKTCLIQDCCWGDKLDTGGIPEIIGNKQILVMTSDIAEEQLLAALEHQPW